MLMLGVKMMVRVAVARAVSMRVSMFMKDDFKLSPEYVGNPAQRPQIWNMTAAFQTRNHRFCHAQTLGKLRLRLTGVAAQLQQFARALGGDTFGVVSRALGSNSPHTIPQQHC
jgi:hypothetical protein